MAKVEKNMTNDDTVVVDATAVGTETNAGEQPKVIFSKAMAGFLLLKNCVLYKVDRDKKDPKRSTFIFKHDDRLNDSLALYGKVDAIIKALKYGDDALIEKLLAVVQDNTNGETRV